MALKGLDISSHQATLDLNAIHYDFVIIKATEGVGYVNPVCDKHYQQAKVAGKLRGVYHFARNTVNSAEAEAEYFFNNIKGYVADGDCLFVLDWEDGVADVGWAKRFLDRFKQLSGKKALIYMSESVVNSYDWSSVANADYGLWVAKYRDYAADFNYDTSQSGPVPMVKWWKFYAMWQWTSSGRLDGYNGNLDLNEFYGDASTWRAYAGASGQTLVSAVNPAPVPGPLRRTYTVQPGDGLIVIGQKTGTDWHQIAALNGLNAPFVIYPNQVLVLPGGGAAPAAAPAAQTTSGARYAVVDPGDSVDAISHQFGLSTANNYAAYRALNPNGGHNGNWANIWPGDKVRIS